MSWEKGVCCFCVYMSFNKYVPTCIPYLYVCVGLCVFLCTVAVCPCSTLEREITSFCQPLPVSICCCLLSPGCQPSLSVKGNAVASNPSRGALFDAHWQEPGSGYSGFPCVSKYVRVLLSGEFHMLTGPKQLRCHSDEHWPLFPSNLLPPCSLFELQCTKGNKMQKSFCTYTNGTPTTSWQIIQTKGWLLTRVLSEDLLIPTQSIWECTVVSHFQRCEIIDLVQNVIGCWPFFCCWVHCHRRNTHKLDGHKPAQVCCTCMWPRDLHQIENEEHDIILI